jgi:serine/threonine protein kinase
MEHVEGCTLAEKLSGGPVPLREAVQIAVEIAEALEHAHDRRIVHRDLKPSNIMLARAGHAKVMDFGLAKQFLGRSPLDKVTISRGYKRWRVSLTGYQTAAGTLMSLPPPLTENIEVGLDRQGTIPPEMVRIRSGRFQPNLQALYRPLPELQLGDYLLDRYEVSNREFKKFVDAGGYGRREYFRQPIVKDGKVLDWQVALGLFVDKTGRPGSSTWELGDYPEGQDDFPVAGVSWYEAAACAEFAGKSLPTIYHWNFVIGDRAVPNLRDTGYIVPLSNFGALERRLTPEKRSRITRLESEILRSFSECSRAVAVGPPSSADNGGGGRGYER